MSIAPVSEVPEDKTQPAFKLTFNPKVFGLLVEEEHARYELSATIDTLLEQGDQSHLGSCKELLVAFKDYMVGVKELGDLLKQ